MTVGDTSHWNDFFASEMIETVFDLVLDTWERIPRPAPDEHEDVTSIRLYAGIVRSKDRNRHAFLIRYQDVEIDFDLAKETGRKDIVFFPPANDEEIYFCLEAKRLNVIVDGMRRSLAGEYVKSGMRRFIDRKYSRRVCHGAMLGYVLDGDIPRAMGNVSNNIRANCGALRMQSPGDWLPSSVRSQDPHAKETRHERADPTAPFLIHHLFVTGGPAVCTSPEHTASAHLDGSDS